MKFLADENFPGGAIRALRDLGPDVVAATEHHGGAPDREIYSIVRREGLVLLTFGVAEPLERLGARGSPFSLLGLSKGREKGSGMRASYITTASRLPSPS